MLRRVLLALALVGLAVVVTLRLAGVGPDVSVAAPEPAVERPSPPVDVELAAEPVREPRAALAEEREVVAAEAELERVSSAELPAVPRMELAGTVVVVDENGVEHNGEDGFFHLGLWSGNRAPWHRVEVREGRWSTALPVDTAVEALSVTSLELGGRSAVPDRELERRFAIPDDGRLELRARWVRTTLLHVRDRERGQELPRVLLVEAASQLGSLYRHPGGAASEAREAGSSPIRIEPPRGGAVGRRTLWARSPGYAWGRIEIDDRLAGERDLVLEPAGELEIVLQDATDDPDVRLRVRAEDGPPVCEAGVGASPLLLEGLPPGSYSVQAEYGLAWRDPVVLGGTRAEVVPNGRTRVALEFGEPPERREVPIAGTLVLPAEWGLTSFGLEVELVSAPLAWGDQGFSIRSSEMRKAAGPPDTFRWSGPASRPGSYEVRLPELALVTRLEVGPEGVEDARIEVPPPAEVSVRCVEAESGLAAEGVTLSWCPELPPGTRGWRMNEADWDRDAGAWRFRAPVGDLRLQTRSEAYAMSTEVVAVGPGANELVLQLHPRIGLRVVLRHESTTIPWDPLAGNMELPRLSSSDGSESGLGWHMRGSELTVTVDRPGAYTLVVPEIPGYEPVPDVEVVLGKGVVLEHVVELRRLR